MYLCVTIQDAVAKYEVVLQNLEFARDLHRQFQLMLLEVTIDAVLLIANAHNPIHTFPRVTFP